MASTLQALESFYEKFDPDFIDIRTKAREVLQREDDLNEIVQVYFVYGYSHRILRYLSFRPSLYYVALFIMLHFYAWYSIMQVATTKFYMPVYFSWP